MSDRVFDQRALGAVLGSAVGDALGAPFEFGPAGQYSARFREPVEERWPSLHNRSFTQFLRTWE